MIKLRGKTEDIKLRDIKKDAVKTKRVNELNYRDHDLKKEGKFLNTTIKQPCSEDGQKRRCPERKLRKYSQRVGSQGSRGYQGKNMSKVHVANGQGRSRLKSAHQLWQSGHH